MQQLFAQLAVEFRDGAEWWLTAAEEAALEEENRPHRLISAIEDQLLDALDLELKGQPSLPWLTPRQVLLELDIPNPTNPQCKECAGVLRAHLGEPSRIHGRDKWRIPFRLDPKGDPVAGPPVKDKFD